MHLLCRMLNVEWYDKVAGEEKTSHICKNVTLQSRSLLADSTIHSYNKVVYKFSVGIRVPVQN